jgi:ferredoxin-NADP reductase
MNNSALTSLPLRASRKIFGTRRLLETIVSPNGLDGYGELLDPTFSVRDVRAEVISVEHPTERSVTLRLLPNANWQGFTPGQHVGLIVEVDGVLTTRYYSPASDAAVDDQIELTVSLHDGGKLSGHLIEHAKPGMIVGLTPPEGDFTLPASPPKKLLLIAGGSGITPLMSMLRTTLAARHDCDITLLAISRDRLSALYVQELEALAEQYGNFNLIHGYTREEVPHSMQGHLTAAKLKDAVGDFAGAQTYVCGPPALAAAAEKIWKRAHAADNLHVETFKLPEVKIAAKDATGTLTFANSGVERKNDGRALLDQAEDSGLSPRCGCRMGICHTCIAHVESGVVRDLQTGEVREVQDEYIQTCVNAPVGELAIDL